jgi:phosphonate transport system substrate-binding protein
MSLIRKNSLFFLFSALVSLLSCSSAGAEQTYTFSVVPQFNAVQLHTEWLPVINRISQETGIKLELVLAPSIPKFERTLLKGEPDFAFANPYHAVMAKRAQSYIPLLRDTKPLTGILLVKRDSPYRSLQDLNGKDVGFPAPNAFGASLYMRALLAENKVNYQSQILNTHGNVFRNILSGGIAAGGGVNNTFNDESPEMREQFRILYQTPGVASHPVIAHPRVPERVRKIISNAFFAMQKDAAGVALLKEIRLPQPVQASYSADYLPLEKLNVEKFVILEKE